MKKLFSVLLAVVLCFALTTVAFAEEAAVSVDTEELSSVVDEIVAGVGEGKIEEVIESVKVNADQLYAAFGDILEGTDTVAADEAADYVITAIADLTGADMEAVREVVMETLDEYKLADIPVVESDAVAGLVDKLLERLEELGIDTTPIIDKLAESKVGGAIIGVYTGETTTEAESVTVEETTTEEAVEIPKTGHASSIAAFAVLAVAAAGAYVCTRKKAE